MSIQIDCGYNRNNYSNITQNNKSAGNIHNNLNTSKQP